MDQLAGIWEEEVWAMPERIFFRDLLLLTMSANPAEWKIYVLFAVQLESNMYGGRGTEKDRAIRAGKLTQFLRRSHFLHNFCKESHTISKCHFLTNFPWRIHFLHILMISYAIEGLGYIESKKSHPAIQHSNVQPNQIFFWEAIWF